MGPSWHLEDQAENSFKTLKWKEVYLKQDKVFEDSTAIIEQLIKDGDTAKWLHSILENLLLLEFEAVHSSSEVLPLPLI